MTRGFQSTFKEACALLIKYSLDLIQTQHVKGPDGGDYLQVLDYQGTLYWCIDDVTHITFLLPEEY